MASPRDPDFLLEMQREIEVLVRSLAHPIVVEDEVELFDLTAARWKLTVEFGKLLFEAWNAERSIARRVEAISFRDRGGSGFSCANPEAAKPGTLEFRGLELAEKPSASRVGNRARFRKEFLDSQARVSRLALRARQQSLRPGTLAFHLVHARARPASAAPAWAFLGLSENEARCRRRRVAGSRFDLAGFIALPI